MDPITSRNRSRSREPDVYWRRRLFALAAGLAVLGLLAWAVGGASAARPAASTTQLNGQSRQPSPPPVIPSPTPTPSPSASSPSPTPSPSGSRTPAPSARKSSSAAERPTAGHAVDAKGAPGDDCPPGDVVLTLTANGDDYGATARPEFTVYVVSTASRTCAFNVGPRYLTVVIESGAVREWGSADCLRGSGTRVAMLARGVPVQRKVTWDRTLSAPGCRLAGTPAQPGTYTVSASDAGVRSHTLVFQLG